MHIVCPSGVTLYTASATHSTKVGSREAATAKILASKKLYALALAETSPAIGAAAPIAETQVIPGRTVTAATCLNQTTIALSSATATRTATDCGYKGKLQELLQIAASNCVEGWGGQLPVYTAISSGPDHCRQYTVHVSVSGPAGAVIAAVSKPMSSRKAAEQAAAAEILQTSVLQQLQATLQTSVLTSRATETHLQRLHQLVNQAGWCMEDINHFQVSNQPGSNIFHANIVINGFLLGRGLGSSKSCASQAAAHMALASMGLALLPYGTAVVSAFPHSATSTLVIPQSAMAPNHHVSITAPPAIPVQCIASSDGYQLPPAWPTQRGSIIEHSSEALSAPPSSPYSQTAHDPAATSVFATKIQQLSLYKFNELVTSALVTHAVCPAAATRTVVSAFLLQQGDCEPEVIALGTGTNFCSLPDQCISSVEQRGRLILDSHAEVSR